MNHFGEWVIDRRKSLKIWTQFSLAERSGLSVATISNIERTGRLDNKSRGTRTALAHALQVDVMELEAAASKLGVVSGQTASKIAGTSGVPVATDVTTALRSSPRLPADLNLTALHALAETSGRPAQQVLDEALELWQQNQKPLATKKRR